MGRLTKYGKTAHENGVCCTHFNSVECKEVGGDCAYGCKWEEEAWSKLAHYEDLEEQGRLIELPCAVGDKVWIIIQDEDGHCIEWDMVQSVHINQYADFSSLGRLKNCINITRLTNIPLTAFGEAIFTTKEEAEAKLKELEEEKCR